MKVDIFPQGRDNWGYLVSNKRGEALAVDPLESSKYLDLLAKKNLSLQGILLTHYHEDHIAGVPDLMAKSSVPVFGPDAALKTPGFVSNKVKDEVLPIENFEIASNFLIGHSKSHCVYHFLPNNFLFVGDLLFHLGCGRVMDCEPETLYQSLQTLKSFPVQSEIFVGHDYREKNYRFATELNPPYYSALDLDSLEESTTLEMELWWNPFLKAASFDEWWLLRQTRNLI